MSKAPKPRDLFARLDKLGEEAIFDLMIEGKSVRSIATELNASATAVLKWINLAPARVQQYRLAQVARAEALADGLVELADESLPIGPDGRIDPAAVNDKRLRIDTRKWIAAKFHPGMYGDKVAVDSNVNVAELPPDQIMAKITDLLAANGMRITVAEQANGPGNTD